MHQKARHRYFVLLAVTLMLGLQGCFQTPPGHMVSWTYTRVQLKAGADRVFAFGASDDYKSLRPLFESMEAICAVSPEASSVKLEGTTFGSNGKEFSHVVFHGIDGRGQVLASTPDAVPNQSFPTGALERLNREIGISE